MTANHGHLRTKTPSPVCNYSSVYYSSFITVETFSWPNQHTVYNGAEYKVFKSLRQRARRACLFLSRSQLDKTGDVTKSQLGWTLEI